MIDLRLNLTKTKLMKDGLCSIYAQRNEYLRMLQLCLSRSGNKHDKRLSSRDEQEETAGWEAFKNIEDIPAWILKMAEDERCYEEAKKQALTELERCRTHVLREFEQRRKQCEDTHRTEMEAMRQKLDKRLKELEQVQTDMALNKFRRLSMVYESFL
ncbi:unnamed protein product [Angiostrongylus costaricensis]|uniref:Mitofilin n=1 Tax=Angiostrongylus costaricensis TaxID=334426 RepID=A0A158PM19_ANGCS|nr:unnamed protein product [Angiostrongylus costaricensis]